jgi:hypothetical protein
VSIEVKDKTQNIKAQPGFELVAILAAMLVLLALGRRR